MIFIKEDEFDEHLPDILVAKYGATLESLDYGLEEGTLVTYKDIVYKVVAIGSWAFLIEPI